MCDDIFDQFVNKRLKEWHGFTYADIRAREFNPTDNVNLQDAFSCLNLLIPCWENAFLFRKK